MEKDLRLINHGPQMSDLKLSKIAVLGAGALGTQIAALFADFGMVSYLFDTDDKLVHNALGQLKNLSSDSVEYYKNLSKVIPANYEHNLPWLLECDLIIEAITDQLDWKIKLYHTIFPFINKTSIVATTTANISINTLATKLPQNIKERFFGVHFFTPLKFMKLLEIIPSQDVESNLANEFSALISKALKKDTLRVKDTCNFIANRIQIFTIISVLHHSRVNRIPPDVADNLTGVLIERSPAASFKTLDLFGLDTFEKNSQTIANNAPDDPWRENFMNLGWIHNLVQQGNLGIKNNIGVYKYQQPGMVYDPSMSEYRTINKKLKPAIREIFDLPNKTMRFEAIRKSQLRELKMLWHHLCDVMLYIQYHSKDIAYNSADIDIALKWGFGWQKGPFEFCDDIGWDYMHHHILQQQASNNLLPTTMSELLKL
jgi:3-hydroxyacyl-CoA dehydrogenase